MLFSDMPSISRLTVVAWAKRQAWGREAVMSADGVLYGVQPASAQGNASDARSPTINFASLEALAAWASEAGGPPLPSDPWQL